MTETLKEFKRIKKMADRARAIANTDNSAAYYKLTDDIRQELVEYLRTDFRTLTTAQLLELCSWVSSWRPTALHSFLIVLSNLHDKNKKGL